MDNDQEDVDPIDMSDDVNDNSATSNNDDEGNLKYFHKSEDTRFCNSPKLSLHKNKIILANANPLYVEYFNLFLFLLGMKMIVIMKKKI
jgi:hypothetical protein